MAIGALHRLCAGIEKPPAQLSKYPPRGVVSFFQTLVQEKVGVAAELWLRVDGISAMDWQQLDTHLATEHPEVHEKLLRAQTIGDPDSQQMALVHLAQTLQRVLSGRCTSL